MQTFSVTQDLEDRARQLKLKMNAIKVGGTTPASDTEASYNMRKVRHHMDRDRSTRDPRVPRHHRGSNNSEYLREQIERRRRRRGIATVSNLERILLR